MGIAATIENPQKPDDAGLNDLVALVADGMKRVNSTILSRTGSDVAMIPEVANHLIASGGKRLRKHGPTRRIIGIKTISKQQDAV